MKNKVGLKIILTLIFTLLSIFSFLSFNFFTIPKTLTTTPATNSTDTTPNTADQNTTNQNATTQTADNNNQNETTKITNTSSCYSVGELWDDTNKKFKKTELTQLIKYASSYDIGAANLSLIKNLTINSNTMRGYNSGYDIIVTLGGYSWTVTYLSQNIYGDPILTLWLSNSNDIVSFNGGFSDSTHSDDPNISYPNDMYGTSYMRAVVLNNGGYYVTSHNVLSTSSVSKNLSHKFGAFTVTTKELTGSTTDKNRIADYLVTPEYVSWQKFQNAKIHLNINCKLANEGWGKDTDSSEYYTGLNYSVKTRYDTWKNDLIWLPSASELGYFGNTAAGVWYISINQRSNTNYYFWQRSAHISYGNLPIAYAPSGSSSVLNVFLHNSYAVRPALHLNLREAINSAYNIWKDNPKRFDSENLNCILKYIYGTNTTATNASFLSSINLSIGSGAYNASQIKSRASSVSNKLFLSPNNDLIVTFGGLNWYATFLTKNTSGQIILTMWLADSGQLYNKGKTGTDGSVKYNVYGSSSWNSGSPPYSDGTSAISNNYGNSNIRTTYFSSASATTNTASVFNAYLKTSSNYTAIGDFVVAPKDLNTQDAQNLQRTQTAKLTLGFRYNLPNESYASILNYSNPYKALSLSASTTNYATWQNDKLWLPSLSEVGLGSNNASTNPTRASGLWGLSTAQRSNTNKTATWLRSGHITDKNLAYTISSDGLDYGYASIDIQNGIRPALHLNLTLACQYVS